MNGEARRAECEVLVCFAVEEEARSFRKFAIGKPGISILVTGIGRNNAEKSVREVLLKNSLRMVLTCGFAGGLNPNVSIGTVVFFTDDKKLREKFLATKAKPAKIICAERIATTVAEKAELRRSTGGDAVEMESEAIQTICGERGIACATVRVISDAAHENLPLDFNQLSRPDMNLDYGKLAWAIAKAPWKIPALMRLQKNCRFAAEELAQVLAKIISP